MNISCRLIIVVQLMIEEYESIFPEANALQDTAPSNPTSPETNKTPRSSIRMSSETTTANAKPEEGATKQNRDAPAVVKHSPSFKEVHHEDIETKMKEHKQNLREFMASQEKQWREIARTIHTTEQVSGSSSLF